MATVPSIFISYSQGDARAARRVQRRLAAHGVKVWLDEQQIRLGSALSPALRDHISSADMVLVIASQASANSVWVGVELQHAIAAGKPIVPFFIEPLTGHERFKDYVGFDATVSLDFADGINRLLHEVFTAVGLAVPRPDVEVLKQGLRELAKAERALAPLILGFLDGPGLHAENLRGVLEVPFHSLDETFNALYDIAPGTRAAMHAAYGFSRAGAGKNALMAWIRDTRDGDTVLATAVGQALNSAHIPAALQLLEACQQPNNQALYGFIAGNADQMNAEQRAVAVRLVTYPVREDTSKLGDVLGWVALKHLPEAPEIVGMWCRWIKAGEFDGPRRSPRDLARYLLDARAEGVGGFDRIGKALEGHVSDLMRSCEKENVVTAVEHLRNLTDVGAPEAMDILRVIERWPGTAEWVEWRARDAKAAGTSAAFVYEMTKEAVGARKWLDASRRAKGQER